MADFFISYNKADKSWAEWIAWQLEEAGYTTVLQAWDITPGTNFVLKMHEALKDAERTIAVLSPDYLTSVFAAPEWAAAFAQNPTSEKGVLVPIRVRQCDPSGLLGPIVYQDLLGLDEAAAKVALLAAVKRGRAKPDTKPAFPTAGRSVTSRPRFPGTLPPIWNVPYRRNPNFTGRENLLQSLHTSLNSDEYAALTQVMHGLGGVGKTQAAVEYAYRFANEYDAVLWVPAEDSAALVSHFATLAQEIGLDVDGKDQPGTLDAVKRWLRENGRWLLVFDNAEGSAELSSYLPQAGSGHVIITSRNPEWRRIAKPLVVQQFSPDEAIAFLLARAGKNEDEDERAAAKAVAQELDGLALALEQAAAYMETHGISLGVYRQLFDKYREKVLSRESAPEYPYTIETVWTISLEAVTAASPTASGLLTLLAFFAPDDIPVSLIQAGVGILPGALSHAVQDELQFRHDVGVLRRHSLIDAEKDVVSIHRVVQAVTMRSLTRAKRRTWAERAIRTIRAALPGEPTNSSTWATFSSLTPHANASARVCEAEQVGLGHASFCLNETGLYLSKRGDFKSAKDRLERALLLAEKVLGHDHPELAIMINNMATVLEGLEKLPEAKAYAERALSLAETAYGLHDPLVATCLNNLGYFVESLGDVAGAHPLYRRALEIIEAALGPNHPSVATTLINLGSIQRRLGEYEEARANCERALQIDEAVFGFDNLDVGIDMHNLGNVLELMGKLPEALHYYERGTAIMRAFLGDDHRQTLIAQTNLQRLRARLRRE